MFDMFLGGLNGDGFGEEYEWGANGSYEHGEDGASYDPAPKATRCKYCKVGGLYWHQVNGRYRLYTSQYNHTSEYLHTCNKYKPREVPKHANEKKSERTKIDIKLLGSRYAKHPDNKYGYGSNEFYEAEWKLWGCSSEQEYWRTKEEQTPKCSCETQHGFSFGFGG